MNTRTEPRPVTPDTVTKDPIFIEAPDLLEPTLLACDYFDQYLATVTPAIAKKILDEHNGRNRNLGQTTVRRYRKDMEAGVWTFAGDPLRFDVDGILIDGQHRLRAVSQLSDPDAAIVFNIMTGLPHETIQTFDQGRKRDAGQQLGLLGIKNGTTVAAAVRLTLQWDAGSRTASSLRKSESSASTAQVEKWIAENADVIETVNEQQSMLRNCPAPGGPTMAAALITHRINPDAQIEFFTALAEGGEPKGSPILALDRKLVGLQRSSRRVRPNEYLVMILRTWTAWRKNLTMTRLVMPSEHTQIKVV